MSIKNVVVVGSKKNTDVFIKHHKYKDFEIHRMFCDPDSNVREIVDVIKKNPHIDEVFLTYDSRKRALVTVLKFWCMGIRIPVRNVGYLNRQYMWKGVENVRYAVFSEESAFSGIANKDLLGYDNADVFYCVCGGIHEPVAKRSKIETVFIIRSLIYSNALLSQLNAYYSPKIKACVLSDTLGGYQGYLKRGNHFKPVNMKKRMNLVITYHSGEARKYELCHMPQPYSKCNLMPRELDIDVFFCGSAKDRLRTLYEAYEYMTNHGLCCIFWIRGVNEQEKRFDLKNINYGTLSYEENLGYVIRSRCIFEACYEGNESTMRYAEAVAYNKCLITNDGSIKTRKFYDQRYMQVYSCIEDINCDMAVAEMPSYGYEDEYSPVNFCKQVERLAEK